MGKTKLICDCRSGAGDEWKVYFCPLHAAAPSMLDGLRYAVDQINRQPAWEERLTGWPSSDSRKNVLSTLEAAMKAAEGGSC